MQAALHKTHLTHKKKKLNHLQMRLQPASRELAARFCPATPALRAISCSLNRGVPQFPRRAAGFAGP